MIFCWVSVIPVSSSFNHFSTSPRRPSLCFNLFRISCKTPLQAFLLNSSISPFISVKSLSKSLAPDKVYFTCKSSSFESFSISASSSSFFYEGSIESNYLFSSFDLEVKSSLILPAFVNQFLILLIAATLSGSQIPVAAVFNLASRSLSSFVPLFKRPSMSPSSFLSSVLSLLMSFQSSSSISS